MSKTRPLDEVFENPNLKAGLRDTFESDFEPSVHDMLVSLDFKQKVRFHEDEPTDNIGIWIV